MADATDTPNMPEMVERVARAISEVLFGYYDPEEESQLSPIGQARLAARAAIAAMREPTDAMIQDDWPASLIIWRVMITAALGE